MTLRNFMYGIYTVALIAVTFLGHVIYHNIPKDTWTIKEVRVLADSGSPGFEIKWTLDLCRHTDKEYVSVNYLRNVATDGSVLINRVDDLDIKKGECKKIEQSGILPPNTPLGNSVVFVRLTTRDTPSELYPSVEGVSGNISITNSKILQE